MRTRDLRPAHRTLLDELIGQISTRLTAEFADAGDAGGPHIGIVLRERDSTVTIEVPLALLDGATEGPVAREALRVRLKGRRDRMLFRPPPARPAKFVAPLSAYGGGGGGFRGRR